MAPLLNLIAVLALVATGISVLVGAVAPGEALRRLGVAMILLLVIPCFIAGMLKSLITPVINSVVTLLAHAGYILVLIAVFAFMAWVVVQISRRHQGVDGDKKDEE